MNTRRFLFGFLIWLNIFLIGFALWNVMFSACYDCDENMHAIEGFAEMVKGPNLKRVKNKFAIKASKRRDAIEKKIQNEIDQPFEFTEQMQMENKKLEEQLKASKTRLENGTGENEDVKNDDQDQEQDQEQEIPLTEFDLMNLRDFDTNDGEKGGVYFLVLPEGGLIDTERKKLRANAKIIGNGLNTVAEVLGETIKLQDSLEQTQLQMDKMNLYLNSIALKSDEAVVFADGLLNTALGFGMIDGSVQSIEKYGESLHSTITAAIKSKTREDFRDAKDEIEFFKDRLDNHPSVAPLAKKVENMKRITGKIMEETEQFTQMWNTTSDELLQAPQWNESVDKVMDVRKKTFGPLIDLLLDIENFYESDIKAIENKYEIEGLSSAIQKFKPAPFKNDSSMTTRSEEDYRVLVNQFNALRELVVRAVMIVQKLKNESTKINEPIQKTLEVYEKYIESMESVNESIKDASSQQTGQSNTVDELSKVIGSNQNLKIMQKINELKRTQAKMIKEIQRLEAIPQFFDDGFEDETDETDETDEVEKVEEEEEDGKGKGKGKNELKTLTGLNTKSLTLSSEITQAYEDVHQKGKDIKDFGDAFNSTIKKLKNQWDMDFRAHILDYQREIKTLAEAFDVYEDKVVNSFDGCGMTLVRIEEFLGQSKQELLTKYKSDKMLHLYIDVMADGGGDDSSLSEMDQKLIMLTAEVQNLARN